MSNHYNLKTYPNTKPSQFDKMGDNADKSYYREKINIESVNEYLYTDFVLYKPDDNKKQWMSFIILNSDNIVAFTVNESLDKDQKVEFDMDFDWDIIGENYEQRYDHDDYIDAMSAFTEYMRGEDFYKSIDITEVLENIDTYYNNMKKELNWLNTPEQKPSEFMMKEIDKKLDFSSSRWHDIDKNKSRIRLKEKLLDETNNEISIYDSQITAKHKI
jgi:hypothetical protein